VNLTAILNSAELRKLMVAVRATPGVSQLLITTFVSMYGNPAKVKAI
jgi:hypothetical protein